MEVEIIRNRNDETRKIAFVKVSNSRWGSFDIPGYFGSDNSDPELGPCNVMIAGILYAKYKNGPKQGEIIPDTPPVAVFLKEITDEHKKIVYEGFRSVGANGRKTTTSNARDDSTGERFLITPGRLIRDIHRGDAYTEPTNLVGGIGYVTLNPETGYFRLEGVETPNQLQIFSPELPDF